MDDLNDLLKALRNIERKIAKWKDDGVYPGDQGYQDMLMLRSDLEERIAALYNSPST